MIVGDDDAAGAAADRPEQDPAHVELDRVRPADRDGLVIDQAAAGIEEQDDQQYLAAKADQRVQEVCCRRLRVDRPPLDQSLFEGPQHQRFRCRNGVGGGAPGIVGDGDRIGAQHLGQRREMGA